MSMKNSDLRTDSNPLIEAKLVHIEAYIAHVDMVFRNEVAFKLTPKSIEALVEYHKEIHCVDIAASTYNWLKKNLQVKELHEKFLKCSPPVVVPKWEYAETVDRLA
ncbi:hypothetical protein VE03_10731 [Pseudogymnoascus sp. 23342-1-I1]|nr:hypothetical protein VE03_10731 [Pseudogymnoascus sp. 23342-1-I1]